MSFLTSLMSVSYTHLDVYKRQVRKMSLNAFTCHYQNWCKRKKYNFSQSKAEEIYGKMCIRDSSYSSLISSISYFNRAILSRPTPNAKPEYSFGSVSYTHLDVYKRQAPGFLNLISSSHLVQQVSPKWRLIAMYRQ